MNTPTPNDPSKSTTQNNPTREGTGSKSGHGTPPSMNPVRGSNPVGNQASQRNSDSHNARGASGDGKGKIADALNCIVDSMDVIVREAPRGAQGQFSSATEKLTKARAAISAYCDASKQDESGPQRMENEGSSTGREGRDSRDDRSGRDSPDAQL